MIEYPTLDDIDGSRLLDVSRDVVSVVREGLPVYSFDRVRSALGVPAGTLGDVLGLAPRTLTRRRAEGRLAPDESDRLVRTARLVELAVAVFEDAEAAAAWMSAPSSLLGGESPLAHSDTTPGAREVEDMLYAIEYTAPA